jgi:hypothetical protein
LLFGATDKKTDSSNSCCKVKALQHCNTAALNRTEQTSGKTYLRVVDLICFAVFTDRPSLRLVFCSPVVQTYSQQLNTGFMPADRVSGQICS